MVVLLDHFQQLEKTDKIFLDTNLFGANKSVCYEQQI